MPTDTKRAGFVTFDEKLLPITSEDPLITESSEVTYNMLYFPYHNDYGYRT